VGPFASPFVECFKRHSTKAPSLSRACWTSSRQKGAPVGPFSSLFAECIRRHSIKVSPLPSATATALSKEALSVPRCSFFAECYGHSIRQIGSLLSVTLDKVNRKPIFYLVLLFHPNKQNIYLIYITEFIDFLHKDHKVTSSTI
jgi:hypothetical protein